MAGPAACRAQPRWEYGNRGTAPFKKGLHQPRVSAIIPNLTAAGSHPDCRAVLIQIVALQSAHIAEIVAVAPDVILAQTTPMVAALRRRTESIPIVFVQ